MITASVITIIIDCLAILYILSGFLFGLKRGLKASINRLLLILISATAALIITKALSGTLMNITLPFLKNTSGSSTSINAYIADMLKNYNLTDTITLGNFTLTIEALVTLVKLFANTIIFILLFELIRFLTWILYMAIFNPKKKDIQAAKTAGENINLHRWWGSVIGIFQGLIVFILIFIPVSGTSSLITNLNSSASATDDKSGKGVIETFVPDSFRGYLNVYENSIFNKAVGWTKFDELVFDTLTTSKIDGLSVNLRNEVKSVNDIVKCLNKYDLIENAKNKTLGNKLDELSNEEIKLLFKDVFDSTTNFTILKCILIDSSNLLADNLEIEEKITFTSVDWAKESEIFSSGISMIVCSVKPVFVSVLKDGTESLTEDILTSDNIDYYGFGKGFDTLAQMQLIKNSYREAVKKILNLEQIKNLGENYGIDLSTINVENLNFEKTFGSIGGLLRVAVNLKNSATIENLTTTDLADVLESIKTLDENLKNDLNEVLIKSFNEDFGISEEELEGFNIFENEDLLDATIGTIKSLENVESDTAISIETANDVLSNIEAVLDSNNAKIILDVVAKSTGTEESLPSVTQAKSLIQSLDDFINADDETDDLNAFANELISSFNAQPSLITVFKFKNNTYLISEAKFNALSTSGASSEILEAFTVIA